MPSPQAPANGARRIGNQEAGKKSLSGSLRIGHERLRGNRLRHQMHGKPTTRIVAGTLAGTDAIKRVTAL